jgi:putative copper export protein
VSALDVIRVFLHVLAATIWVGGQLTLAALVPVLRRVSADAPKAVARQFRRVAWPAFGVLLLTGVWNLLATDQKHVNQGVLTAKMIAVLASGLAAFLHQRAGTARGSAIWGAVSFVAALAALLLGVILGGESS